jgi:hypothetical protein
VTKENEIVISIAKQVVIMNVARIVTSRFSSQSLSLSRQALFSHAGVSLRSVVTKAANKDPCDKEEFLTMMTESSNTANHSCEEVLKENEGLVVDKESAVANLLVMQFLASKAPEAGARFHDS